MHFDDGRIPQEYRQYIGRKIVFLVFLCVSLLVALLLSISFGAAHLPLADVASSLIGLETTKKIEIIVWNIRLPQSLSAMVAGAGLALSGAVMQSILRNPLGSPFTLGIAHAAAFGAAVGVMLLGGGIMTSSSVGAVQITNPYLTTIAAFICSIGTAIIIVAIARMRGVTPEVMVLTGVALGSFFTAGTMLLQFFANDVQLAAMVFWTFGDTARASWNELIGMFLVVTIVGLYFFSNSWNYNAIDAGEETAKGLGVRVERVRTVGMLLASVLTATVIGFLGIIGFVGLVVPHMVRRIIGSDHRFLLPASFIGGALMLLASDTVARLMLAPHVLPVSVLTAFIGAPVFLILILQGGRK